MELDARRRVAKALTHPTRISILMKMNEPRRRLSPKGYTDESGEHLSNVSYHFRCLSAAGLIKLVDEQPVRGSTQHFYEPVERAMAWAREYAAMSPAVRQNLAATALRGGVEAIGNAVDAGSFDRRTDSHLSYQTMRVDDLGWQELTRLFDRTLKKAMEIGGTAEDRMPDPDQGFLASYLMSAFEAAPPSDLDGAD
jgi:DNA-binding transcriptional ArsR family regulator